MENKNGSNKGFLIAIFVVSLLFVIGFILKANNSSNNSTYTKQDYYNEHSDGKSYEQWTKDQELLNDMKNESDRLNQ